MNRKTPNGELGTPNIEWLGVREDEGPYGTRAETHPHGGKELEMSLRVLRLNVERWTLDVER